MTERGVPSVEGSPACPFVAFEDDRDERADRPDHRHRCYAEAVPAPRALAHQEAYCLSSAFPVCPTFQEWARRESARARASAAADAAGAASAAAATAALAGPGPDAQDGATGPDDEAHAAPAGAAGGVAGNGADGWRSSAGSPAYPDDGPAPRRNPPRDWAAPPPWASGAGAAAYEETVSAPDFIEKRSGEGVGLAGSPADRIASGNAGAASASVAPDPELAGLVAGGAGATAGAGGASGPAGPGSGIAAPVTAAAVAGAVPPTAPEAYPSSTKTGKRPAVSSTRAIDPARDRERERERAAAAERAHHDGPAWERSRRYEAYPTIKTRAAMPNLPRVGVLFGALLIAAAALFFLPQFLSLGGGGGPGAAPSASVRPSAPVQTSPTPEPVPTAQNYTIKQGDTLSKVAKKFHVTLDELLAANKDTIKDADKIAIGDVILIPVAVPDQVPEASAAPEVSATP